MTGSDTRNAILAAARKQLAGGGSLSINGLAAAAGVSRQTVHRQFGGARGLRAALATEGLIGDGGSDLPTRERLVSAAERVLSRPGGGEASIEAIAAEAGLTKGAVYHHFADRAELLRALAKRISPVDELAAALLEMEGRPTRDGLARLADVYYRAIASRADLIRSLAANASRDPELGEVIMTEVIGRGAPLVLRWFDGRVAEGTLRPVEPSFVIQALFAPAFLPIVLGAGVFDRLRDLGIHLVGEHVEAYVDLLLAGAAPAASPGVPAARAEARAEGGPRP